MKILVMFIVLIIATYTIYIFLNSNKPISKLSMFSWSSEEITNNRTTLINDLVKHEFDRVFQSFPRETPEEEIVSYTLELTKNNIDVYGLSGTPEWALDSSGNSMIEKLQRIVQINEQLPNNQKMKGLVIDVEPYLLDEFEWEDQSIQTSFISGMKSLYKVAKENELELIVVVPYFYDTKGYQNVLSTIIHEASSEIAVMNYYRNSEIEHLSFEAKEAKKANKPLTTIYEFIPPGKHDLSEKNTYYNEGIESAKKNASEIVEHYHDQTIHIAYHDYHSFKEVIERD